jgi:hypothetical protein
MDNIVIRPFQETILECLNKILSFNGIDLNLYFVTLQPIEFTELDNIETRVKREEETGEKLSAIQRIRSLFKQKEEEDEGTVRND